MLIGRDCPILPLLLGHPPWPQQEATPALAAEELVTKWDHLPLGPEEVARLTEADPTRSQAQEVAQNPPPDSQQGPYTLIQGVSYRHEGEVHQLVMPQALQQHLLYLANEPPLAGHQTADQTLARMTRRFSGPGIWAQVAWSCLTCPESMVTQLKGPRGGGGSYSPYLSSPPPSSR